MKKTVIIMLFAFAFFLFGCANSTEFVTVEQSQKNFLLYEKSLEDVANQYNLELLRTEDSYFEDNQDRQVHFILKVDAKNRIEIDISNSAIGESKGVESFSINYVIESSHKHDSYNLPLFVDLANCLSGKELTNDFCEEFLSAPESKYAATRHGFQKLNGEKIAKQHFFNFQEDWKIFYTLSAENEACLTFSGLTKKFEQS